MAVDPSHGLLSTNALLAKWGVEPIAGIRAESRHVSHPEFGSAVIRDQKPIHAESLAVALDDDLTVDDWIRELDSRVFFFLQPERLEGLLKARSYRKDVHTVITLDTATLLAEHGDRVQLSRINSGFARPHSKARRGRGTFQTIADYRHPQRLVAHVGTSWDVAELCVVDGVVDVARHVVSVTRVHEGEVLEQLT